MKLGTHIVILDYAIQLEIVTNLSTSFLLMGLGINYVGLLQIGKVLSILLLAGSVVLIASVMNGSTMIELGTFQFKTLSQWRC